MFEVQKIDHIGIRVRDKDRSVAFYQSLGFTMIRDIGFEQGHPVIMKNANNVVLNILGPSSEAHDENILMDVDDKRYAGYTHIALRVNSIKAAEDLFDELDYPITERMSFNGFHGIFIRDPDRNVIEFDSFEGDEPKTRQ